MRNLRRDSPILFRLLFGIVAAALLVVSGCGTAGDGKGPAVVLHVSERDVHIKAPKHVLFCNMYGHYLGGMHAELVVS